MDKLKNKLWVEDGGVTVKQGTSYSSGKGFNNWSWDAVWIDKKLLKKIIKLMEALEPLEEINTN